MRRRRVVAVLLVLMGALLCVVALSAAREIGPQGRNYDDDLVRAAVGAAAAVLGAGVLALDAVRSRSH